MGTASRRALACLLAVAAFGCSCVERRVANLVSPNRFVRNRARRKLQRVRKGQRAEAVRVLCEVVRGRSHLLDDLPGKYPLALRTRAAELLWRLKDPSAEGTLIRTLQAEELAPLREYAARGLALSKNPRALAALERATTDADADVRAAAVTSLYGRKGSEDVAALARIFEDDPAPRVRTAVVQALGRTSSPDAVQILLAASRDPSRAVRRSFRGSGLASRGVGEREITDAYVRRLSDPEPDVAWRACDALRYIGNRRAVPALAAALDERGLHAAARALGSLPDLRAVPALARALKSEDAELRQGAARALASYGPYALEHLVKALDDDNWDVRDAAFDSLKRIVGEEFVSLYISDLSREELLTKARVTLEGRDEPRRVSSPSGEYEAVVRRHTVSLLDREGNVLWTKLTEPDYLSEPFAGRRSLVSDLGWVFLWGRFISRTGEEPAASPVRGWLPGESGVLVTAAEVSPDGRHAAVLVTAREKSRIVLCDEQGRALWKEPCPRGMIPVFAPDGRYVACLPGADLHCAAVSVSFWKDHQWTLTVFSLDGNCAEVPALRFYNVPLWDSLGLEPPTRADRPKPGEIGEPIAAALRSYGALDCTPLGRRMRNRSRFLGASSTEGDVDLGSVPWHALASGDGVLVEHFAGLFLFPRSAAPKLVEFLAKPERKVRRLFFEVLRKMAGRSFGYFPDAPEADRAGAIERWQSWAEAAGKAQ